MDLFVMTETQNCKNKAFRRLAENLTYEDNLHEKSLKQLPCIVSYRTGGVKMGVQEQIMWGKRREEIEAEILEGGEIEREVVTDSYVLVPYITSVLQIITCYVLEVLAYFE